MKWIWLVCIGCLLMACQGNTQEKVELKTQQDSISYAIGKDIGRNLRQQSIPVSEKVLARGIKDGVDSVQGMMTDEQGQQVMQTFQQQLMAKQYEKQKTEGEQFLAENKKKPDVKTTASGLQYKIEKMGTGPKPQDGDTVTIHYVGKLTNGTEFQSSVKLGQPMTHPVNQFIKGWTEALKLMPVGSKWTLYVPQELAYGEHGAGNAIPPYSALIFEVELLAIK